MADDDGGYSEGSGMGGGDDSDAGSGDLNVFEESPYLPNPVPGTSIPHYYGDYVRQLFILAGILMLIFSPFLAATNPAVLPFEIGGAIVTVILAALTSPINKLAMVANAIVSVIGVITYEMLALAAFFDGRMIVFIEREAIVLIFLLALYFSVKTARNMFADTIGKRNLIRRLLR